MGRVRSGQEVIKNSRAGSGHEPRETNGPLVGRASTTRESFFTDRPAHPARGSDTSKCYLYRFKGSSFTDVEQYSPSAAWSAVLGPARLSLCPGWQRAAESDQRQAWVRGPKVYLLRAVTEGLCHYQKQQQQ